MGEGGGDPTTEAGLAARRCQDAPMTERLASMGGDTAADFDAAGDGPTVAPAPLPLKMVDGPLDDAALRRVDAWWRASNYLAVAQIYLMDTPLLPEPLAAEQVKPRLLGHFGTVPGLNLVWAH